jgi:hypothetical protein
MGQYLQSQIPKGVFDYAKPAPDGGLFRPVSSKVASSMISLEAPFICAGPSLNQARNGVDSPLMIRL